MVILLVKLLAQQMNAPLREIQHHTRTSTKWQATQHAVVEPFDYEERKRSKSLFVPTVTSSSTSPWGTIAALLTTLTVIHFISFISFYSPQG
ncbi:MAG: hypothetical protein PV344_06795, partial [Anaplasma sp.]|nr:hypothetical protein [Anaplasma sp.]